MKLFMVQFDDGRDYVEAENMMDAIGKWHRFRRSRDDRWDNPETPEPDGCSLVHEEAVIR